MSEIKAAKQSPRIENGILKWYEGDNFKLRLGLELADQDGESIQIVPSSEVKVEFKNRREEKVKTFTFTDISGDTVTLAFDGECSALFPAGVYHYRIFYTAEERTTICADNLCVVE